MIKAIIFDWDDVIVAGSTKGYINCYHETLSRLGVFLEAEEEKRRIFENWGKAPKAELSGLLKEHPGKLDEAYRLYDGILLNSDTFVNCVKPINGVNILLENLAKKYALAIATGIHPVLLKKIMDKFNTPKVFSKIISAYDIEEKNQKPSPYSLNEIMAFLKVKSEETIYVGDAKNDVLMARNARIEPIVVLTGHLSKSEAEVLKVKHIIPDVTEIEEVLESIGSK
ncbi:MAG: HAD family hydrolase [Nanoarchaeota archaeon]|nr:HAD family hydrolase [Nanoarchaeota archaeon]MBU4451798.1 HAD family hydrolase [Nanoarchaeota archaeon]MCG2723473.1 HAD family hydrolase [archaeon]